MMKLRKWLTYQLSVLWRRRWYTNELN